MFTNYISLYCIKIIKVKYLFVAKGLFNRQINIDDFSVETIQIKMVGSSIVSDVSPHMIN